MVGSQICNHIQHSLQLRSRCLRVYVYGGEQCRGIWGAKCVKNTNTIFVYPLLIYKHDTHLAKYLIYIYLGQIYKCQFNIIYIYI